MIDFPPFESTAEKESTKGIIVHSIPDTKSVDYFAIADPPDNTDTIVRHSHCSLDGFGTGKDSQYVVEHFRRAANLGNKEAKLFLGLCYGTGEGVGKSESSGFDTSEKYTPGI